VFPRKEMNSFPLLWVPTMKQQCHHWPTPPKLWAKINLFLFSSWWSQVLVYWLKSDWHPTEVRHLSIVKIYACLYFSFV
jgi:hypothetical protein